jgi:hypothetical protein
VSRWFRHYAGMCSDPKFGGIARRAKVGRDRAVFVFAYILECASEANSGGAFAWDADAVADILNCETAEITAVYSEIEAAGLVADGMVTSWAKRQFESDKDPTNADRQRKYRARNGRVTGESRPDNAAHSTETETEEEKKEEISVPSEPRPKQVRTAYPDDFERFWNSCAQWRGNSGKREAFDVWRKLSSEDKTAAAAGVPGYSAALRVPNAPSPLHVCRFLKYRRFEVYTANVLPFTAGADPPRPTYTAEEKRRIAEDFDRRFKAGEFG